MAGFPRATLDRARLIDGDRPGEGITPPWATRAPLPPTPVPLRVSGSMCYRRRCPEPGAAPGRPVPPATVPNAPLAVTRGSRPGRSSPPVYELAALVRLMTPVPALTSDPLRRSFRHRSWWHWFHRRAANRRASWTEAVVEVTASVAREPTISVCPLTSSVAPRRRTADVSGRNSGPEPATCRTDTPR